MPDIWHETRSILRRLRRQHLITIFSIVFVTGSLLLLCSLFSETRTMSPQQHVRLLEGAVKPNGFITMIVAPKSLGTRSQNGNSRRQLRFVFESWAQLDQVDFVIVSHDHEILQMAKEFGLLYMEPPNGNDVENLTYRSLLRLVDRTLPIKTEVVGFSNGDIMYDESLVQTTQAVKKYAVNNGWNNFVIEGTRTNIDVPSYILNGKHNHQLKRRFDQGTPFQSDAQDYFIFNRGINLNWDCIPPFLIGGVYFDNWFSGLVISRNDIEVVDASETLKAYHLNHGKTRTVSHENAASMINLMIGHDAKNYISRGFITDAPWKTKLSNEGISMERRETPPNLGDHYMRYAGCHARGKPLVKKGEINRLSE